MEVHATEPTTTPAPRQHVGVSANVVRAEFLDRSMEATARNLEQFDPSPEIDSHLEWAIAHIQAGRSKQAIAAIRAAIDSNRLEGTESRAISHTADQLCADLERMVVGQALGIKSLCRQLRPVLRAIDTGTPAECADALLRWREIHGSVPCAELTRPGVRRELGVKLCRVLDRLVSA